MDELKEVKKEGYVSSFIKYVNNKTEVLQNLVDKIDNKLVSVIEVTDKPTPIDNKALPNNLRDRLDSYYQNLEKLHDSLFIIDNKINELF